LARAGLLERVGLFLELLGQPLLELGVALDGHEAAHARVAEAEELERMRARMRTPNMFG
jgi:hypothetical protein